MGFLPHSECVLVCAKTIVLVEARNGTLAKEFTAHTKRAYGLSFWRPALEYSPTDEEH